MPSEPDLGDLPPRFRLIRELGRGASGFVMLAEDLELERQVAVKLLIAERISLIDLRRFRDESRISGSLRHPHLVQVLDARISAEKLSFIVYEFVDGVPLTSWADTLEASERAASVRRALRGAGAGLQYLHENGVLHRDISPGNILVEAGREHSWIADLGLARVETRETMMTRPHQVLGTLAVMAPEVFSKQAFSPAADQYSLAACAWMAIHGETLFPAEDMAAFLEWLGSASRPQKPGRVAVPKEMAAALTRAMDPDPEARFKSVAAFVEGLGAAEPKSSHSVSEVTMPSGPARRIVTGPVTSETEAASARSGWGGIAWSLLLVGLVGVGWFSQAGTPHEPPPPPDVVVGAATFEPFEEAEDEFRQRLDRFEALHRTGSKAPLRALRGEGHDAHLIEVLQEHSDPRFTIRFHRLLQALVEYVAVAIEDLDLLRRRDALIRSRMLPLLRHLQLDTGMVRAKVWAWMMPGAGSITEYPGFLAADEETVRARFQEATDLASEVLRTEGALGKTDSSLLRAVRYYLAGTFFPEGVDFDVSEALAAAGAETDPDLAAELHLAILSNIPPLFTTRVMSCPDRLEAFRAVQVFTQGMSDRAELRGALRTFLVYQWFHADRECRTQGRDPLYGRLIRNLAADLEAAPEVSATVLRWVEAIENTGIVYAPAKASLVEGEKIPEIRELRRRADALLAAPNTSTSSATP